MQLRSLVLISLTTHLALPPFHYRKKKGRRACSHFLFWLSLYRTIASVPLVVYKQTGVWTEVLSSLELRLRGKDNLENSPLNYWHTSIFKLHSLTSILDVGVDAYVWLRPRSIFKMFSRLSDSRMLIRLSLGWAR